MNRIKRISMQLIERHAEKFSSDYEKNKEVLSKIAIIRSKQLRNEVAGYITAYVKRQGDRKEEKMVVEEITESLTE
ncbi:MAG: 30S ribosomal protein S17e [Nitrososphaerales archaeon]